MEKSEIRKDYFQDNYVIIAPKRKFSLRRTLKRAEDQLSVCYFCPEQIDPKLVISKTKGDDSDWQVMVLKNKYPALTEDNPRAFGKQEIIIETPLHKKEIYELSTDNILRVFNVYIDRYEALKAIKGIKYVLIFKNEGGKAGASITHSHSQATAFPLVPPEIEREYSAYAKYQVENGTCPYCNIIEKEKEKNRVIFADEYFFVLCPYASHSPYAAWFIPKRHFKHMTDMTGREKESLAKALKKVLAKLDGIDVPYNYFFHNAVFEEDYHMHLKLSPRPNIWGGVELGTGIIINPISPEDATKFYQE